MTDSLNLTPAQLGHAHTIAGVGSKRGLPASDITIAIMVALDESSLLNLANSTVPASLAYPHDGVGSDADSVGLFQQRPSQGWGTVAQCMDPATAAGSFYDALSKLPGRGHLAPWAAAQMVQKSADSSGSNYQKYFDQATALVNSFGEVGSWSKWLTQQTQVTPASGLDALVALGKTLQDPAFWRRAGVFLLGATLVGIALWRILDATGATDAITKAAGTATKAAVLL